MFNQELAKALSKENVEVTLIASSYDGSSKIFNEKGIRKICLASPDIPPRHELFQITRYKALSRIIRESRPDIINLSSNSILPRVSKTTKIVSTVHGSILYSRLRLHLGLREALRERTSRLGSLLSRFLFLNREVPVCRFAYVSRTALEDDLSFMTISEALKRKKKSVVIHQGIDAAELRTLAYDLTPSEEGDENIRIMFMGRFTKYKGVLQMLPAFKYVFSEVKDAHLDMFGGGPLLSDVSNQIRRLGLSGRVSLHGIVPRKELIKKLSSSYMVVHPSLVEAGCMVGLEAYSFGKPLIAHSTHWSREFVEGTHAGLTASVFEPKRFAEAILSLLSDRGLYRRLSTNAFEVMEERFSSKLMARKYIDLYRGILT